MARQSLKSVMRLIEQTKSDLPAEQLFLEDLKRSIELTAEKGSRPPSQFYKPSSMRCIRNMFYQRIGAEPVKAGMTYTGVGIVNSGSDIHVRLQTAIEAMKDNGIDCEYVDIETFLKQRKIKDIEVKSKQGMETKLFHKKLFMSFLTDGIIKYQNHYYIFEAKTEISSKFWRREGVDPSHFAQATAYSVAFGLDEVLFVYVSRDTLDMKAFLFTVTDEMKHDLVGKIDECEHYVKNLTVPPKPKDIDKRVCGYCSYQKQCKGDA